jgi:hypothetical protein
MNSSVFVTVKDLCVWFSKDERYIQNVIKIVFPDIPRQGIVTKLTWEQSDKVKEKLEKLIKIPLAEVPTSTVSTVSKIKELFTGKSDGWDYKGTTDQFNYYSLTRIIEVLLDAKLITNL